MRRYLLVTITLFLIGTLFISCNDLSPTGGLNSLGGGGGGPNNPGGGATPGGAQDFNKIREIIENGNIPQPDNFLIEGIYSEYDLPIYGEESDDPLVIRTAHGFAAERGIPGGGLYAQVGLSSNIDLDNFERNALNLSVVVDRSGSMASRMGLVRTALKNLVDQLNPDDLLSIVLFNKEMSVLLNPTPVGDKDRLKELIETIQQGGGTNIDAGLVKGYEFVREHLNQDNKTNRVILMTDFKPNVGNTDPGNFRDIVLEGAEEQIGLIGYGLGTGYDSELMDFVASVKYARYNYIGSDSDIEEIFNDEFKFIFSPLATDLKFKVTPSQWFTCNATYGFPGSDLGSIGFDVSTVFLSHNRGALMLKFAPDDELNFPIILNNEHIADVTLSYMDVDGNEYEKSLEIMYGGGNVVSSDDSYFEQNGVRLTIALTREVLGLIEACTLYYEDKNNQALNLLDNLARFLIAENDVIGDDKLGREIDMVQQLSLNIDPEGE